MPYYPIQRHNRHSLSNDAMLATSYMAAQRHHWKNNNNSIWSYVRRSNGGTRDNLESTWFHLDLERRYMFVSVSLENDLTDVPWYTSPCPTPYHQQWNGTVQNLQGCRFHRPLDRWYQTLLLVVSHPDQNRTPNYFPHHRHPSTDKCSPGCIATITTTTKPTIKMRFLLQQSKMKIF